jgi:hypothetical protein
MTHNPYAPPESNVEGLPAKAPVTPDDLAARAAENVSTSTMQSTSVAFDSLPKQDKWRFVWGFFWRSLCIAAASALGGALAGAVIGFVVVVIAQALGNSLAEVIFLIRILSGTAGLVVGFAALWQLIRWCFRANWFGYRLRLVKDAA